MPKDSSKNGLHDDPFYIATKTATCAAVSAFFSYLGGGSATIYGVSNKICDSIADSVADPAHVLVHGQTYEQKNGNSLKK